MTSRRYRAAVKDPLPGELSLVGGVGALAFERRNSVVGTGCVAEPALASAPLFTGVWPRVRAIATHSQPEPWLQIWHACPTRPCPACPCCQDGRNTEPDNLRAEHRTIHAGATGKYSALGVDPRGVQRRSSHALRQQTSPRPDRPVGRFQRPPGISAWRGARPAIAPNGVPAAIGCPGIRTVLISHSTIRVQERGGCPVHH